MSAKILSYLLVLILAFLQVGFVSGLPFPISTIIIVMPFLLRDVVLGRNDKALIASCLYGLAIDLSRPEQFGVFTLSLFGMTVLNQFLFHNFFTNTSLWSLVMLSIIDQVFLYLTQHLILLFLAILKLSIYPLSWRVDPWIIGVQFFFNLTVLFFLMKDMRLAFMERFRHSSNYSI